MTQTGFLEAKRIRPGSAAAVILLHGAAITALLMAKGYVPTPQDFIDTEVRTIDLPPPPPPPPPPTDRPRPPEEVTRWTAPPTPRPTDSAFTVPDLPPVPPPDLGSQPSYQDVTGIPETPPQPRPAPPPPAPIVRRDAVLISGDLQPPYPTSEERAEREGTVVIQVVVGPDGRVKGAQKVRATSDAFYDATERHARSRWRFRPATVDGRAVEARKTLTVQFRLNDG